MDASQFIAQQKLTSQDRAEVWEAFRESLEELHGVPEACLQFVRERFDKVMAAGGWFAADLKISSSGAAEIVEAFQMHRTATSTWMFHAVLAWMELWHEQNEEL